MDGLVMAGRRLALRSPASHMCRGCRRALVPSPRLDAGRQRARAYASSAASSSPSTSTPIPDSDIYDVVCVGGGPAGLSLLAALRSNPATAGLRVALVEAQDLSTLRSWSMAPDRFSNRCSSLTPASARFLERVGAWDPRLLRRDRVQPYRHMQVWDGLTDARVEFDDSQGTDIAYMTENLNLTSALLRRLDELGGVTVCDGARVEHIGYGPDTPDLDLSQWPVVHLSGGRQLAARLLVGADGANSPVRAFAGIESRGWDYDRHGVVATLELEPDGAFADVGADAGAGAVAYQRFLPTGPIALLPMPGRYATLVWSTTPANAALLKRLSPRDFVALVNAAFRLDGVDLDYMHTIASGQEDEYQWRAANTTTTSSSSSSANPRALPRAVTGVQEGTVASFPLRMRHADTYVGERVALVGDAAHTIHPLAGQGLNQGQGDAESLAGALAYAVEHGMDLGARASLEPYCADRYAANHVLLGVVDKLHKLYAVQSGPLVPLRALGLDAVNRIAPLKNFFMRQAAGGGGGSGSL